MNFDIRKLEDNQKLEITNSGDLSLFWIGTGSAFSKKLYQTNLLIIKGKSHLLVDCGTRCSGALVEYGSSIMALDNIFVTHSHADHIGGVEEMALLARYVAKKKVNIVIIEEYQKILWEKSLAGGLSFNERNDKGKYLNFFDYFNPFRPQLIYDTHRPVYEYDFSGINIKMIRTSHIPDCSKNWSESFLSFGIIIDDKILFTADTMFDPELITDADRLVGGLDYIFHDTQFFKGGVHAAYEDLKSLPDSTRNKMFLTHYGDNYENFSPEDDGFLGFAKQGHYYTFK